MTESQKALVLENESLVHWCVHHLGIPNTDPNFDDYTQEGMIGLCKAAQKFDPQKGFTFATFAVLCIEGYIKNYRHYHCQPAGVAPPAWETMKAKNMPLIQAVSLSTPVRSPNDSEEECGTLEDFIPDPKGDFEEGIAASAYKDDLLDYLEKKALSRMKQGTASQNTALCMIDLLRNNEEIRQVELSRKFHSSRQNAGRVYMTLRDWAQTFVEQDALAQARASS